MTGAVPGDPRLPERASTGPDAPPAGGADARSPNTDRRTGGGDEPAATADGDAASTDDLAEAVRGVEPGVGSGQKGNAPVDAAGDAVRDGLTSSDQGHVDGDTDRHGLRAALSTMTTRMMAERTVRASEAAAAAAVASSEAAEAMASGERVAARPYYSPFKWGFYGGIGVLLAYIAFLALDSIRSTLILIAIATLLAIGLNPIVTWLAERGLRRGFAVALVFLALLLAMAAAVYAIVPPIVNELGRFIESIPEIISNLQRNPTIQDLDQRFGILQALSNSDFVQTLGTGAAGNLLTAGVTIAGIFVDVLIILILTLYFLAGFPRIKHGAFGLVPRSRRTRVVELGDRVLRQMGGYLSGATIISIQAGLIAGIFASIVGLPYPWAIALGAAVLDFIPIVGPVIVGVSMTLIGFTQGIAIGIIAGAFYLAQHMFETYWLYPRVMRRTVDISTGAVVVAIIVGGALLGVTGAILAVPVAAAVIFITREVVMPIQENS